MTDFLDEIIAERTKTDPAFPEMVEAAFEHRQLMRELAAARQEAHVSQTKLAAAINTSQSQVARAEGGDSDVRVSTISKMAVALGKRIEWRLVDSHEDSPVDLPIAIPATRA